MGKKRTIVAIAALAVRFGYGQAVPGDADDPPARAARLSFVSGTVSFQPGGVEEWAPAPLNRPLTTGDRLWTEEGSRAELHTGGSVIRLNRRTSFTFLNLNDAATQIQVSMGTVNVRLRRLSETETFEIDTPQLAFSLLRPGEYRVDVNDAGDATIVTIRGGEGEAAISDDRVIHIRPRQQVRVAGLSGAPPTIDERDLPVADNFDNFCADRDRHEDRSESVRHVSREVPGIADLDEHGVWREDAQYGWIWAPRVAAGWAPYHTGHWAWISPWGWTWVDDAPWGYAPFHYGRWAYVGAAWVWVPGPPAVRPVYAPALVAWVGGPSFSVSLSIGGGAAAVGWFPLAPGEVWVPAYHASPRYFNQVNVSNTVVNKTVNITNVYNNVYVNKTVVNNTTYVNQNVNGAVTAVPQNAMTSGRPVAMAAVRVPQNAAASAQIQQAAPVVPQKAALLSGAASSPAAPPAQLGTRAMVARATPPPAPTPFAQQQTQLQANPGRPLARSEMASPVTPAARPAIRQLRTAAPAPLVSQPAPAAATPRVQPNQNVETVRPRVANPQAPTQPRPEVARPQIAERPASATPNPQAAEKTAPHPTAREARPNEGKREPRKEGKREEKKEEKQ